LARATFGLSSLFLPGKEIWRVDVKKNVTKAGRMVVSLLMIWAVGSGAVADAANTDFSRWLAGLYPEAEQQGISRATWETAFSGVTGVDERVLEKARYQPEFTTEIWDYLDARVNPLSIGKGEKMAGYHARTLAEIEKRFGVEQSVLLAIWSMESNYGDIFDKPERLHYVPRALATLAYGDPKRQKFARSQLFASLKILQAGDISKEQLTGSWAGAMGHTQFIPTSYLAYGVDMDGNGRRDIWNSIPDALATAANLLRQNGWRTGKTWGYEVILPVNGERLNDQTKTLAEWQRLGLKRPKGTVFPWPDDNAVLKIFAGTDGPAFLMMKNFYVLKRYNNADSYALAVGLLADRLAGGSGLVQTWPRPAGSLSVEDKIELQERLQRQGFYSGEIDGHLGAGTTAAIREFQIQAGLVEDGVPSRQLLLLLRKR
jgi:membrane-bound lytic murein transglycosylase B